MSVARPQRIDRQTAFSGTRPVAPGFEIDAHALADYLTPRIEGFAGPVTLSQFKGGQSNPTYVVDTPERAYVLRRKPPGALLPSAHAVEREYRVMAALHATGFPVPRPYLLCGDADVIGTPFYVMDKVEGDVVWEPHCPDMEPSDRAGIYESMNAAIATLHSYDPDALGLGDFGRPENYLARQVARWSTQYAASKTQDIAEMDALMAWLPDNLPDSGPARLVHGDYRLDNLILARERVRKPEATFPDPESLPARGPGGKPVSTFPDPAHHPAVVRAVLDWELSTLGDPLADFTYHLMQWVMPPTDDGSGTGSLVGHDLAALGIPDLETYAARYCERTGRDRLPDLDTYFAYNFFRLAAILQGIVGRVREGTATNPNAAAMARQVRPLARTGWAYAERAGA